MAQPVWVTNAGSLGTIPEGIFYQVPLIAYDPTNPNGNEIYYTLLAGQLPPGIQCSRSGLISGTPQAVASIEGVPLPVNRDTTSTFAVRAYTERTVQGRVVIDRLADRTFSLTITGQNPPQFITPAGNVGTFYDGAPIDPIQILSTDPDPGDVTVITVANGALPPGLSISEKGLITGYIIPASLITNPPGFDRTGQNFDMFPFDFLTASPNTNYQFTLEITDGKASDLRTFEIYVYNRSTLQASSTNITDDNTFVDASQTNDYLPFLVNAQPSNLGSVRAGNFWAYQFQGLTFGQYIIEYLEYPGAGLQLPPGTHLDPFTGWLYGYLPDLGATEITYNFALYLVNTDDHEIKSNPYYFTITLVGQVETQVIWLTDADLGSIINGSTSLLRVQAVNTGGRVLQYRLRPGAIPPTDYVPGVYNKLPQGLQLLPEGDIAGRVSFNTFALDLGTTTFDKTLRTSLVKSPQETTFDTQFTFTVNAYSSDGLISVFKTFTVKVLRVYNEPYENLYIKAMPPYSDRALINSLILNSDIFPPDLIFRPQDPNFGIASSVVYHHAYGLTSATYETYVSSLIENHYWKNLILGEIKTAQAIDPVTGNVIYEVVYSAIQDDQVNNDGISVSKQVTLPYAVDYANLTNITTVYPNSLDNMRNQVIDVVGQISNLLPLWMLSKQSNGRVLGFTPAWVIAYCKPGTSGQVAYNVRTQFGQQLNLVDFEVDRYELDRLLSINWDPVVPSMTFDPAHTGNNLVISDRGLSVKAPSSIIGYPSSLTTRAINPNEKVMFSVTIDVWAPTPDTSSVGIANHLFNTTTQYLGSDLNSIGFWDDGLVFVNSNSTSGYPTFEFNGAVIDVAVDRLNNLIWIRVNGGLWNNSTSANPAAATGGVDISYITGIVYPGVSPWYDPTATISGQISINTTAKYTVPAEFKFIGVEQGAWVPPAAETTFDLVLHYELAALAYAGANYEIGSRIVIPGSSIGGTDELNSVTVTVQDVDSATGAITIVNLVGTAPLFSQAQTYYNVSGTTTVGTGTGALFDFVVGSGNATTFDATSMRFEAPVDIYTNTDAFDKYLVFPRRNILV
jgi:hypothetical protein